MGFLKLVVCLTMLMTLTSTWARSSSERQRETGIKEVMNDWKNGLKRYIKNEADNDMIVTRSNDEDSLENYENHLRKFMKFEAEKLLKNEARNGGKRRRSLHGKDDKARLPFSARRLEKMLEKAILKIITGDLSPADMLLLKSLNYSLEEVLAIRERELGKKINPPEIPDVDEKNHIFYDQKLNNDLIESHETLTESSPIKHLENNEDKSSMKKKKKKSVIPMSSGSSSEMKIIERPDKDVDFEAYNRQAVYDYENGQNIKISQQSELDPIESSVDYENHSNDNTDTKIGTGEDDLHTDIDRPMESHVVFKIRYDDSEFDSGSDERMKKLSREQMRSLIVKNQNRDFDDERKIKNKTDSLLSSGNESVGSSGISTTPGNNEIKTFQESTVNMLSSLPVVYRLGNFVSSPENLEMKKSQERPVGMIEKDMIIEKNNASLKSLEVDKNLVFSTTEIDQLEENDGHADSSRQNEADDHLRRNSIYEGLEWVEDDVYRVIPEAIESLNYYDVNDIDDETIENIDNNETRSYEIDRGIDEIDNNDTIGYQNENAEDETNFQNNGGNSSMRDQPNVNLSTYQQLALAHRREGNFTSPFGSQGQKAIEDIKLKILAMTGRFNLSSSSNQVQRERLKKFLPICQQPRNTDSEAWSDQFLMNMNFQLNLTSSDHVVAAKLRIYRLPQDNMTVTSAGTTEEEDEEEKKIRISIYYYTKSLKKHRSKKRLMDSVVIALTTEGSHLALDVRQALRFWRQNLRNSHATNNHGLVIQVEDQEGRPLKPSQYIQQDSCHTSELNEDDKAYQRVPALFIQACSRYVRVVNGEVVTYVKCGQSSRNERH